MKFAFPTTKRWLPSLALLPVLVCLLVPGIRAQDFQNQEVEFLIDTLQKQVAQLQAELAQARGGENKPVEEALVEAQKEAEDYRIRYRDLSLRIEALGLDAIRTDKALQDRLAKAVGERELYKKQHEETLEQLEALKKAVEEFLPTAAPKDPKVLAALKTELEDAETLIVTGTTERPARKVDLNDGKIISYKDELSLAVLNIGSQSGVMVGMPFNIYRKDRLVGTALAVQTRDQVCGAIVQEIFAEGDRVRVGDKVKPRTTNSVNL